MIVEDFDDLEYCRKCQFYDDGDYCRVYDKACEKVEECYQYIEEEMV